MDLAAMEAIATDLSGRVSALEASVGALENKPPADSIAVPNTYIIGPEGQTINIGTTQQTGFALLESSRDPTEFPGAFTAPGAREWELLDSEGIIADTLGAFPEKGFLTAPGNTIGEPWNNIPTPFTSLSIGALVGHMATTIQPGQHKLESERIHFDLYQLSGTPGTQAKVRITAGAHQSIALQFYNHLGQLQTTVSGSIPVTREQEFDGTGIMYVLVRGEGGEPPILEAYEYSMTVENVAPNPFVFPTFDLPEGFIYLISAEFSFRTSEAKSSSGLFVVEINADLEPGEDSVQMTDGDMWCVCTDTLAELAETPGTPQLTQEEFVVRVSASTMLLVPKGQVEKVAKGGAKVREVDKTPGNTTHYAWETQKLSIQQLR